VRGFPSLIEAGDKEHALDVIDKHMRDGYDHVSNSYKRHSADDKQYVHPITQERIGGD